MRAFSTSVIVALANFAFTGLAIPIGNSLAKSRFCQNAPTTIAGTMLDRRETDTVLWCCPHSETYVILTPTGNLTPGQVYLNLISGHNALRRRVQTSGDGPVTGGQYTWGRRDNTGVIFSAWNVNNHQLTYGVIGAAMNALLDYMDKNVYSGASFDIYDGQNQVGQGLISD